mgnify:CR=1 FL=1
MSAGKGGPKDGPIGRPLVARGDHLYFGKADKPRVGRVLAHGEHGVTLDHGGARHKVRWSQVLGHKSRNEAAMSVVDHGEDGYVVESGGRRRFVHDPLDAPAKAAADTPFAKALDRAGPLLVVARSPDLLKAIKNTPGLTLQDVTDKAGHATKRWKRTAPDTPGEERPRAGKGVEGDSAPPHKPGDRVRFKVGAMDGEGVVVAHGKVGARVRDASGHVHKVRWSDMAHAGGHPGALGSGEVEAAPGVREGDAAKKDPTKPFFAAEKVAALPDEVFQPHHSWEALTKAGAEGLEQFRSALGVVARKLKLRTDIKADDLAGEHVDSDDGFVFIAPLKGEKRAREKVAADYNGDWSELRDVVRGTISVRSMADVHNAIAAVEAAGLKLAKRPKDRFAKPTPAGYRDLLTIVRLPNGMLAELQFHIKAMTAAKADGHEHYEVERSLQAKYNEDEPTSRWSDEDHSAFYQARKKQREIYGAAWSKVSGQG